VKYLPLNLNLNLCLYPIQQLTLALSTVNLTAAHNSYLRNTRSFYQQNS